MDELLTHERSGEPANTRSNVRAGIVIFLAAGALFALFGSNELVSMAYDLPESRWTLPLVTLAEQWNGLMEQAGTAAFSQTTRDFIAALRTSGWPD